MKREWEEKMALSLKEDKKYITDYELARMDFDTLDYSKFSPDTQFIVGQLVRFLASPILIDDVEDNPERKMDAVPDTSIRKMRSQDLKETDEDLYRFYDSNRLQSSNIGQILQLIDMAHKSGELSGDLYSEIRELAKEFVGENHPVVVIDKDANKEFEYIPSTAYMGVRYLRVLDNKQKLEFVKKFSDLVEQVVYEIAEKHDAINK